MTIPTILFLIWLVLSPLALNTGMWGNIDKAHQYFYLSIIAMILLFWRLWILVGTL